MVWDDWPRRWDAALRACAVLGGKTWPMTIAEPATELHIQAVEAKIGVSLPIAFRTVLREFPSCVDVRWSLPSDIRAPGACRQVSSWLTPTQGLQAEFTN